MFHIGHLNILNRASKFKGPKGKMIVGISSDKFNFSKKTENLYLIKMTVWKLFQILKILMKYL